MISSTARSADLVPTYATALSGEALKVITGLTNATFQEINDWSQAMIDGISNYAGAPEPQARCNAATAAIDAAIDERLPELEHARHEFAVGHAAIRYAPRTSASEHQTDHFWWTK